MCENTRYWNFVLALGTIVAKSEELEEVDVCELPEEETNSAVQYKDEDVMSALVLQIFV